MTAVDPADGAAAGLAAAPASGFFAGAALAAGVVCEKHNAEISKQIERQIRMDALRTYVSGTHVSGTHVSGTHVSGTHVSGMDAPGRSSPGWAGEGTPLRGL
jgi:hypothetical protein